jgi:translation initiation factor IF-1
MEVRRMMRALVLCLAAAGILALAQSAPAEEIDKDFHRAFDVAEGVTLRLDYGDGDVSVTPWDKDVIDVTVRYHAEVKVVGFGKETGFDVEFRQDADRVTVRGIEGGSQGIYILNYVNQYEYTYAVKAPSYAVLDLSGDDGDLDVTGWRADIHCSADDGDVTMSDVSNANTEISIDDGDVGLTGLECDLVATTDDGDISLSDSVVPHALFSLEDGDLKVADSSGSFDVSLDDGDVVMSRVAASVVDVRGQDGDIDLDVTGGGDVHVNVSTDDGDVMIRLGSDLSFAYLVTVDNGRVDIGLDNPTDTEASEHRVSGRVGDGGGLVRVSTDDGTVHLVTVK